MRRRPDPAGRSTRRGEVADPPAVGERLTNTEPARGAEERRTNGSPAATWHETMPIAGADGPPGRDSADSDSGAAAPPAAFGSGCDCTATGSLSSPDEPPEP